MMPNHSLALASIGGIIGATMGIVAEDAGLGQRQLRLMVTLEEDGIDEGDGIQRQGKIRPADSRCIEHE